MCVYLCVCVCICMGASGGRRGNQTPAWRRNHRCLQVTQCGCWEPNSGPLQVQQALLTTEPSLQHLGFSLMCVHHCTIMQDIFRLNGLYFPPSPSPLPSWLLFIMLSHPWTSFPGRHVVGYRHMYSLPAWLALLRNTY